MKFALNGITVLAIQPGPAGVANIAAIHVKSIGQRTTTRAKRLEIGEAQREQPRLLFFRFLAHGVNEGLFVMHNQGANILFLMIGMMALPGKTC